MQIFLEKSDEREFLFRIRDCTDPKLLFWIVKVDWNFFVCSFLLLQILQLISGLVVRR
jgi:hypothetical protein